MYPQQCFEQKDKKIKNFPMKFLIFTAEKNLCILHEHGFVIVISLVGVCYLAGQRPIIIVPIDSHFNLPQNKTHSYALQLIVDPNTFSSRENAPGRVQVQQKNRVLGSI